MTQTNLPLLDLDTSLRMRHLGSIEAGPSKMQLPLQAVSIEAAVAETIAAVTVKQSFNNPYTEHLEAAYIFPLPGGSTISRFELRVGARLVKGEVQERNQARQQYQQAMEDGKRAALLEQERDDVFTMQVGNLPPGETVTVELTYNEQLNYYNEGFTELRLPLVVAPRYTPGKPADRDSVGEGIEFDTDIVPDASRISPPRLAAGVDPQVALTLTVELESSHAIEGLACSQHSTSTSVSKDKVKVALSRDDEKLDRDFVLRWKVASENLQSTFLFFKNPDETDNACYGMISVLPPSQRTASVVNRDIVFVLDRSGSMADVKMASAARALSFLLTTLGPKDRFAIQAFDTAIEWMESNKSKNKKSYFTYADQAGIENGQKFLRQIYARGGTELDAALGDALTVMKQRTHRSGRMPVIVLLTDGEISDEARILKRLQKELSDNRVFTIGVDTAVNEGFLKRLALIGGGTSTFVEPGTALEAALTHVSREIASPLVVDLTLEAEVRKGKAMKLESNSVAPSNLADVFAGRAVTAFFKFSSGDQNAVALKVKGSTADGKPFEVVVPGKEVSVSAIAKLWAKHRIIDLEDAFRLEPAKGETIKKQIVELSIRHSIFTKFTAFVAVDEAEIVNADGSRRKVLQPVAMPAQWEMGADAITGRGMALPAQAPAPGAAFGHVSYGSTHRLRAQSTGSNIPAAGSQERFGALPPPAAGSGGWGGASSWGQPPAGAPPAAPQSAASNNQVWQPPADEPLTLAE
ncbi:MAG TPA: VIT domain-containing protein, partial [Chroococcales cyanobacterium]